MKLQKLVGERYKERPSDCIVDSHALMIRGGYMKYVANGIYSLNVPLKRITHKIEQVVREEMNALDGQEVQLPVVMPATLWQESGRYDSIGKELLRFSDRSGTPMVLGMTHEEAAVQLVRDYARSYTKYPFMIYQIQTKFRDEARPRAGLIRVREFTMKDAYSFHTSIDDLKAYYSRCLLAYERIFRRVGIPEVVSVASDSGMMGGNISHEFMLLTPVGEDSIVICTNCNYKANMEAAESVFEKKGSRKSNQLSLVYTPNKTDIPDICTTLGIESSQICKAVVYQQDADSRYIIVFIRGDSEVNETKLTNYLGNTIHPADITDECELCPGYIGPFNLTVENSTILYDRSLENEVNLCCGANQKDYHYIGLDIARDLGRVEFLDLSKAKEGGICPCCGRNSITISRGIEVGNIFQLGNKYTKSMNMTYTDPDGNEQYPVMGCYGIGIGRLAASVCEAHHDKFGPIWPMAIAPWQVHICAIRIDDKTVRAYADKLYYELQNAGVEVIYDDRHVSVGVMFSDADLLGVPLKVTISPKNIANGTIEVSLRETHTSEFVPADTICTYITDKIAEMLK